MRATPLDDADELCRLGAAALAAGYATGRISPVEAARATLERAEVVQERFNAFVTIDAAGALAAASESEARWRRGEALSPIDGVPTTIKDIVSIRGHVTGYGSATGGGLAATEDAPSVARLRAAGAVTIGTTTTPEFGWKALTDSPARGITRNPWAPWATPGGSSGGAAVAAATGAGALHLGTDGGGSIRVPSSFTGIVGLKPTFGRVAAHPPSAFGTLAHIGPMTRSAEDAALMLAAMSGRDLRDWNQGPGVLPTLEAGTVDLAGLRIGHWSEPPCGAVEPEVAAAVASAVAAVAGAGAVVEPFALPAEPDLLGLFNTLWFGGAAVRLAMVPEDRRGGIDPGFLEVAAAGAAIPATDMVAAGARRAGFGAAMDQRMAALDLVISPATALAAFAAGEEVPPGSGYRRWTEWAGFSFPLNLGQQPAAVIPCGFTADGRPIGLQLVGARGADGFVLAAAAAVASILAGRG